MTCGKPSYSEVTAYQTEGSYQGTTRYRGPRYYTSQGTYSETAKKVEKFYYKFKENSFIHILTFVDGVLKKIETGGRITR